MKEKDADEVEENQIRVLIASPLVDAA